MFVVCRVFVIVLVFVLFRDAWDEVLGMVVVIFVGGGVVGGGRYKVLRMAVIERNWVGVLVIMVVRRVWGGVLVIAVFESI